MALSLQSSISSPCLSAALPHELCFSVGPEINSTEVHIRAGGGTISTATLYSCKQRLILFACRSIIHFGAGPIQIAFDEMTAKLHSRLLVSLANTADSRFDKIS